MRLILVGGPQDGLEVDAAVLLPSYRLPRTARRFLFNTPPDHPTPAGYLIDEYALGLDHGHPSRDDLGRIRYVYTPTEEQP